VATTPLVYSSAVIDIVNLTHLFETSRSSNMAQPSESNHELLGIKASFSTTGAAAIASVADQALFITSFLAMGEDPPW